MNATERASHPSRAQVEALLDFLQRNPGLAKGFSKVPSARDAARRSWDALALQLNSLGGCVKTSKQWIKYWADKKSAVKKKCALRYRARYKTGGGAAEVVEMTEVEEKIVTLMGGESFSTGDRHLAINPFETSANSSQGQATSQDQATSQGQATSQSSQASQESISLLDIVPLPLAEERQHLSTPSTLSDTVISTRISHRAVAPSPPHTPPGRVIGPASPPLPTTPSGSGAHPLRRNVQRRPSRSPIIGPSPITTPTNRRSRRRQAVAPPSQRLSQFSRMTERFLAIEEQRMEVDRRNSLLREAIVNHTRERDNAIEERRLEVDRRNSLLLETIINNTRERDNATTQALLAIGEGLKLLGEALKK